MTTLSAAVIGLWHETNTYSSRPATLQSFQELELLTGDDIVGRHQGTNSIIGGFLDGPFRVLPIFSARAWPSGPADSTTAAALLERLNRRLERAAEADVVLLAMHGAMVSNGHPDMELEVLRLARLRWPAAAVGIVLDLHGNPSADLLREADVTVGITTYPHEDMRERGLRLTEVLAQHLQEPRETAFTKVPLLTSPLSQATSDEPMRDLVLRSRTLAREASLDDVSVLPGFAYSDVARAGFTVTATGPKQNREAAQRVLHELRKAVFAAAGRFIVARPSPREAVRLAAARTEQPVALVDVADNIGGGGAGDGTALLKELLDQQLGGAIVTISDPAVAGAAHQLGRGQIIHTMVGARTDNLHGQPVVVHGEIEALSDGLYTAGGTWLTGQRFSLGKTAVVRCRQGVILVVTERAVPPFHKEQLTVLGLDVHNASAITFKGAVAWRADYADIVKEVVEVDTPGACPLDPMKLPRRYAPATG